MHFILFLYSFFHGIFHNIGNHRFGTALSSVSHHQRRIIESGCICYSFSSRKQNWFNRNNRSIQFFHPWIFPFLFAFHVPFLIFHRNRFFFSPSYRYTAVNWILNPFKSFWQAIICGLIYILSKRYNWL